MTVVSFLDLAKYPPSLLFLLMTLGPALIFLALVDEGTPKLLRPAVIYGKVPMFYFLVHLPLIHGLAAAVCLVRYGSAALDVRVAGPRSLPVHGAAGLGVLAARWCTSCGSSWWSRSIPRAGGSRG